MLIRGRSILACTFTCRAPGTTGFTGGEDVLGWNLLKQVARFHDVWTLTNGADRPSIEQALKQEPIANVNFCYVDLPRWLRPLVRYQGGIQLYYFLWQIRAYFTARSLHKRLRFDLFHHITYANDWMASFTGALLPIPYIRGPGGGAHQTPKGFEKEYPLGGRLWEKIRAGGQWLFRHDPFFLKGQNRARAILVCNQESLSKIPSRWSHKTHLFPVNGVSSKDLARAAQPKADDGRFRILSAGTLIRVKGLGLAIKAFEEFAGKHPQTTFDIIGSGPEEPRLRLMVSRSQLQAQVHFRRAMPRDQLLGEMASHDVFLFPSLRDGGGAVVIEAMSVGKPVVCLDAGGPGMHITEECGLKVAPRSPTQAVHELAEALERLYLDKKLRQRLGSAARRRAEQHYHWDRLGERLREIYGHALEREGAG